MSVVVPDWLIATMQVSERSDLSSWALKSPAVIARLTPSAPGPPAACKQRPLQLVEAPRREAVELRGGTLPDAAWEDAKAAGRLKAELQALVGPEGPSREMLEDWRERFPPPRSRRKGRKRK